jgi:iron complex transport system substrate-binding protein
MMLGNGAIAYALGTPAPIQAVSIPEPAAGPRVVSLAPSLTEIVCAVGGLDALVGRTSACDYPPDVAQVRIIGGFGTPSLELLAAVSPTVVFEVDLDDQAIGRKIDALGLRRVHVPCDALDDVPAAIRTVGSLIDRKDQAHALAASLREKIAALRARAAAETDRPSVYVEIWHDPVMTAGTNSFLSELVYLAGGRNIGDELRKDYCQVSPEWIVAKDPDVILCLYMSDAGRARSALMERSGWRHMKAVTAGAVFDGFDNNLILRPGPRVLESIDLLRACIRKKASP